MTLIIQGISIEVTRKKIKNIHLRVRSGSADVQMSVPRRMTDAQIEAFATSKLDWIIKHRERALSAKPKEQKYLSGETLYLFGKPYTLRTEHSEKTAVTTDGECIILYVGKHSTKEERETAIKKFYKAELERELTSLLAKWEGITNLKCASFSIRDMKTRWGSCSVQSARMRFNLGLAERPIECVEYVVLHELAHLRVSNHGAEFKAILDEYMPNWRERKNALNAKM